MPNATTSVSPHDTSLIDALLRRQAFDHPADAIELVETHISWVILAGDYAYKIKKPLVLDFLDFGTLEKRRHCCEEELRLNRPWAPDIYLDVVPITMHEDQPCFGGDGDALEYAVRMRRFDQQLRLDRQLADGLLTVPDMKELGRNIAERHAAAERPVASRRMRLVEQAIHYFWENFDHLDGVIDDEDYRFLHHWTGSELDEREWMLWRRFDDGFVRDCHGDLHLGNLVRLPDGITTFDCIEFNPDLRLTDVFADVGFLAMDLVEKGRRDLASHFLNRYLECSGDYAGAALLDLYFVYRCLVRAKVAAIRSRERRDDGDRRTDVEDAKAYGDMARRQATKGPRVLVFMCGLSGSGKTWLSERLMAAMPAIRIRSDIERKRLFGVPETEKSGSGVGSGIYSPERTERVYRQLTDYATTLLAAGHHVILDAAFLNVEQREAARRAATDAGCTAALVHVVAPQDVLRERIRRRAASQDTVSEADLAVLEKQLSTADAVAADENAMRVDSGSDVDVDGLAGSIHALARSDAD